MTMATSTGGVLRLPVNLASKVLFEDWQNKLSDVRAFCPICREEAQANWVEHARAGCVH